MAIVPRFRALGSDLWDVLRSRATLVGLVFFVSPVGSSAVQNLISSVGPDYHASDAQVAFVSGLAGGLLSALGCVLGGFVCDRMNRMTAYALTGSPHDAEDLVQETLLRAWRSLDRFERRASVRTWLYRIATNVCLDMLRGRQRRARPMEMGPSSSFAERVFPSTNSIAIY